MKKLIDWLLAADEHGDSPIGLIIAIATFISCMAVLCNMPGY